MYCPQYENLNIATILAHAKLNPNYENYIPEDRDIHRVPRQWLINIAYTVIGKPFNDWVQDEIVTRNEELAKKQKLLIEMDSEIAKAFHGSVNISSSRNNCKQQLQANTECKRSLPQQKCTGWFWWLLETLTWTLHFPP